MFSLFIVNFWWLSTYLCSYNLEEVIDFCSIITCHVCMSLDVDIIHSPQRSLGKGICLLILFSTLLACYVSSLLYFCWQKDEPLLLNLRLKFCPGSLIILVPPLTQINQSKQALKLHSIVDWDNLIFSCLCCSIGLGIGSGFNHICYLDQKFYLSFMHAQMIEIF
jgi:hypothetical protein